MSPHLSVQDLSVDLDGKRIVDAVLLDIQKGAFVGLVGPNGSGKSTLLRTIYRVLKPRDGQVILLNDDVWKMSARDAAKRTAVVAQERMGDFEFTVGELVAMGRYVHKRAFETENDADRRIVENCLFEVGLSGYEHRSFMTLSGGEKQRVLVARALAQQASFIVLDEPTNHLDIRHQLELLELISRAKTTTLAALHDLALAARYCDQLVMLDKGKIVGSGTPEEVLTEERIEAVYGVRAKVLKTDEGLNIQFALAGQRQRHTPYNQDTEWANG